MLPSACTWVLLGSSGVCEVLQPIHWFIAHGRARAFILRKEEPSDAVRHFWATPGWMGETAWFSGTRIALTSAWYPQQIDPPGTFTQHTAPSYSSALSGKVEASVYKLWSMGCEQKLTTSSQVGEGVPSGVTQEQATTRVPEGTRSRAMLIFRPALAVQCKQGNLLFIWRLVCYHRVSYSLQSHRRRAAGTPKLRWKENRGQMALLSVQGCWVF